VLSLFWTFLWDLQFQQASTEAAILELDKRVAIKSTGKASARRSASTQPILFRAQGQYFVKVDHTAVPVSDASCFAEAVEFLYMSFFVFWVEYPFELRLFYSFLEQVAGLKPAIKSTVLNDLNRKLTSHFPSANSDQ